MRLIDADEFIEYCRKGLKDMSAVPYYKDSIKAMIEVTKGFIDDIEEQPTIDAAPVVHAHWIEENTVMAKFVKCSNCGIHIRVARKGKQNERYYLYMDEMKFCPNCGAKMDEEKNEVAK